MISVLNHYCSYKVTEEHILYTLSGKPFLDRNEVYFNTSYRNMTLIIVISSTFIGCDIEFIDNHLISYPSNIYSNNEKYLSEIDHFILWSMKESMGKLIGSGIISNLKYYEMINSNREIKSSIVYKGTKLYFKSIVNKKLGYILSVCTTLNIIKNPLSLKSFDLNEVDINHLKF